jgi:hypothetical protein
MQGGARSAPACYQRGHYQKEKARVGEEGYKHLAVNEATEKARTSFRIDATSRIPHVSM